MQAERVANLHVYTAGQNVRVFFELGGAGDLKRNKSAARPKISKNKHFVLSLFLSTYLYVDYAFLQRIQLAAVASFHQHEFLARATVSFG